MLSDRGPNRSGQNGGAPGHPRASQGRIKRERLGVNQIAALWSGLDTRRRIVTGLAAAAAVIAVLGLARMAAQPSMALLYAGLDPAAAGGVTTALETRGVAYEVRGDAIFVPENRRDSLRMALAAEGRPESGAAGYELLDGLSGFGATAQMFDAAYWRAKEGELARTILSLPQVRRARVHVANPVRRPFERGAAPTASVAVTMAAGALPAAQAQAIRHLVAAAVPGLTAEGVTVIDARTGRAMEDMAGADSAPTGEDRAARLKANVERLLAARVGAESVIVEVAVETDMNSETVRERTLDPDGRVAIHSDTVETNETAEGEAAGVTVASNLPDGNAGGGGGSKRQSAETRERVNYEVSEVLRERVRRPGEVRRISVAVLVDGLRGPGPDGAIVWSPRPDEEMAALRELVETAIGFDPARGDAITLRSLEFVGAPEMGAMVERGFGDVLRDNAGALIQAAILGLVALLLGLFVLRPLLAPRSDMSETGPDGLAALPGPGGDGLAQSLAVAGEVIDAEGMTAPQVVALRLTVQERNEESAGLLAAWLESADTAGGRA